MVHFVAEGNHDEARIFVECLTRASRGILIHNQAQTYGGIDAGLLLGKKFDDISVTLTYDLKTRRFDILSPAFILNDVAAMLQLLEHAYCKQNKYLEDIHNNQDTHLLGDTSAFDKIPEFASKAVTYLKVATCFFCDPCANPGGFVVTADQNFVGSSLAEEEEVHHLNALNPACWECRENPASSRCGDCFVLLCAFCGGRCLRCSKRFCSDCDGHFNSACEANSSDDEDEHRRPWRCRFSRRRMSST